MQLAHTTLETMMLIRKSMRDTAGGRTLPDGLKDTD
jgi:hypothetical protein